ncbi:hypothetical protein N7476_005102 [Penicillium atrosanguineum]|uniref:F-box domain-containing protein n=1 Tax=Penicillium atrosanguineum TaxID=1132637 RepID=A0A9W9PZ93_9EURO|nr:hypothetical protein N7476_005102 [Penicillium atrosanguineum]
MQLPEVRQAPGFCFPSRDYVDCRSTSPEEETPICSFTDPREQVVLQPGTWKWKSTGTTRPMVSFRRPKAGEPQSAEPSPPSITTLERLPTEILSYIISYLALDMPTTGYSPRNVDLISCLLSSRALHAATLSVLYRTITFSHSVIFSRALHHISQHPALGTLVRRLDFSQFTSIGLGRTRQMNAEIQNLTSRTLMLCLDLLPNLRECLLQEHLEGDLSADVIRKLFTGLPGLQAVDFCGCSTQLFSQAFTKALSTDEPLVVNLPNLQRLSLHECSTISTPVLGLLLCRLTHLTHLDLARTQVSDSALLAIPKSAQITHLNLSRCNRLRSSTIVRFLTTHAAVRSSLVHLNLMADSAPFRLSENDLNTLLPQIPRTMRSLNLGGARISSEHMHLLVPLTRHLEELGLSSADLSVRDINSFFVRTANTGLEESSLCYLDLSKIPHINARSIFTSGVCILSNQSWPLQAIELSDEVTSSLRRSSKVSQSSVGWNVQECGRRNWYVRDSLSAPRNSIDDGSRPWKCGARYWGMRKVPTVMGEVGGLYHHYMFKK